jgi:hypothetical protein
LGKGKKKKKGPIVALYDATFKKEMRAFVVGEGDLTRNSSTGAGE